MQSKQLALYKAQARIMKALAHTTRLFIVHQLSNRPHCVNELTQLIGADTSTVSKHLTVMRDAGIVDYEKKGTNIYYSLKMPCIMNFFSCANEILRKNVEEQMVAI